MYLILFTVLLYVGLQNLDVVLDFLMRIVGLFFPFLWNCICIKCSYAVY